MEDKIIDVLIDILKDTEREEYWNRQLKEILSNHNVDVEKLIESKEIVVLNKMKLGLDIHGVLDNKPEFFRPLTRDLVAAGWEVHVITGGSLQNGDIERHLKKMDISYTHIFSVYDHLMASGAKTNDELGVASRWPFPDETWNSVKSEYCAKHEISMHIDDMPQYLEHFTTPYMLHKDKNRNHYGQFGEHSDER